MQENSEINQLKNQIEQLKQSVISSQNKIFFQDKDGTLRYYNSEGKLHNDNGPAVVFIDGTELYYDNGLINNLKGTAINSVDGSKIYYVKGNLHNEREPSIDELGTKYWYNNGQLNRGDDLPAIETKDGDKFWFKNGLRHRENDRPAIEINSVYNLNDTFTLEKGSECYFINGVLHRYNNYAIKQIRNYNSKVITDFYFYENGVFLKKIDYENKEKYDVNNLDLKRKICKYK